MEQRLAANNQTVVICMINFIELVKLHLIAQNKKGYHEQLSISVS